MVSPNLAPSTGFRLTPQRQAILDAVHSTECHPDATWIYERVRQSLPHISLGTVYRNLGRLAQEGLIRELVLDDQVSHWDGLVDSHDHIVCVRCGRVANIEVSGLPDSLTDQEVRPAGYLILGYQLCLRGLCPECQAADGVDGVSDGHAEPV